MGQLGEVLLASIVLFASPGTSGELAKLLASKFLRLIVQIIFQSGNFYFHTLVCSDRLLLCVFPVLDSYQESLPGGHPASQLSYFEGNLLFFCEKARLY